MTNYSRREFLAKVTPRWLNRPLLKMAGIGSLWLSMMALVVAAAISFGFPAFVTVCLTFMAIVVFMELVRRMGSAVEAWIKTRSSPFQEFIRRCEYLLVAVCGGYVGILLYRDIAEGELNLALWVNLGIWVPWCLVQPWRREKLLPKR